MSLYANTTLTRSIDAAEARQITAEAAKYPEGSKERLLADSVMQVAVSANYKTVEKLREEDPIMCDNGSGLNYMEISAAGQRRRRQTH